MNYTDFIEKITCYYKQYESGLKKQANALMKTAICELRKVSAEEQDEILVQFCTALCDTRELQWMLNRGNGRLPFELHNWLRDALYPYCVQNRMPHLRWYYELYKSDETGHKIAADLLFRAYQHEARDRQTVELLLKYWLHMLGFGAHHFPAGCCVTEQDYQQALVQCLEIVEKHDVAPALRSAVEYYRKLYAAWERYEDTGREADFHVCCNEEGISFKGAPMFF